MAGRSPGVAPTRPRSSAAAAWLLACLCLLVCTAAQSQSGGQSCGGAGQRCCCKEADWQNAQCCSSGHACTMFRGQGFGFPPAIESLCLPTPSSGASLQSTQACGKEGGPCCISTGGGGFPEASCGAGLACVPSAGVAWGSKAQLDKLLGGFAGAARDASVMGKCIKFAQADCGKAYMPCGKDAAAAGVSCPGGATACPSGFYCAAKFDAVVGERCLPLPAGAGTSGNPCLPNNLQNAPVVKSGGGEIAPPFCAGSAVCFASVAGDADGWTHDKPKEAKGLASRLTGTRCVDVPSDCGSGAGKQCCPTTDNVVTDKPLPSSRWGDAPCDARAAKWGLFCDGPYSVFSGQKTGTCTANAECGAEGQACCRYTTAKMAGMDCPATGKDGTGYCTLMSKCRTCPKVVYLVEDILRCY